jgi:hypothetical protein
MRRDQLSGGTGEHAQAPQHARQPKQPALIAQLGGEPFDVDPPLARGLREPPQPLGKLGQLAQRRPEEPEENRRRGGQQDRKHLAAVDSVRVENRGNDEHRRARGERECPDGARDDEDGGTHDAGYTLAAMRAPSQRRALGALFLLITIFFVGVAASAYEAEVWVVVVAAGALALWMGTMAVRALRPR